MTRARIFKLLRSPEIDSKESIPQNSCSLASRYDRPFCRTGPPSYIECRNRFLGSLKVWKYHLRRHGILNTTEAFRLLPGLVTKCYFGGSGNWKLFFCANCSSIGAAGMFQQGSDSWQAVYTDSEMTMLKVDVVCCCMATEWQITDTRLVACWQWDDH